MTFTNSSAGTSSARASWSASPSPSITVESRKLRAIFTALAWAGSSPMTKVCFPSTLKSTSHLERTSAGPAAMMSSSPFAAAAGRPNTGAAT